MMSETQPVSIILPDYIYKSGVESFEKFGACLARSVVTHPRMTYSVLALDFKHAFIERRAREIDASVGMIVDRSNDDETIFDAATLNNFDLLPKLGNEASEVVIKIIKSRNFFQSLTNRKASPEPQIALRFEIPEL